MNLPRKLLLRVVASFFFTNTAADKCLAGSGIRNRALENCGTAVVAPKAGSAALACARARPPVYALPASSPISSIPVRTASSCSALSHLDAVPSSVPRDAAVSCEECAYLFILVTSFVPEK